MISDEFKVIEEILVRRENIDKYIFNVTHLDKWDYYIHNLMAR